MQFMNRLNMLSDSHLEIPKIPFAKSLFQPLFPSSSLSLPVPLFCSPDFFLFKESSQLLPVFLSFTQLKLSPSPASFLFSSLGALLQITSFLPSLHAAVPGKEISQGSPLYARLSPFSPPSYPVFLFFLPRSGKLAPALLFPAQHLWSPNHHHGCSPLHSHAPHAWSFLEVGPPLQMSFSGYSPKWREILKKINISRKPKLKKWVYKYFI